MPASIRPVFGALAGLALLGAGCALQTTSLGEGVIVVSGEPPGPNSAVIKTHFGPVVVDGQPSIGSGEDLIEAVRKLSGYNAAPYRS